MAHEMALKDDDIDLITRCINGNQGAWDIFVRRYSRLVYYSIIKTLKSYKNSFQQEDIEDIFNNIFLSLIEHNYKRLRRFDPRHGCTLSSWIRLISIRQTIDFLRAQRHHFSLEDEIRPCQSTRTLGDNPIGVADRIEQTEVEDLMEEAIETLPSSDKLFIELYYEKELTPERIADIMNVSINTIYSKKNRIREKIKRILQDKGYIARNQM